MTVLERNNIQEEWRLGAYTCAREKGGEKQQRWLIQILMILQTGGVGRVGMVGPETNMVKSSAYKDDRYLAVELKIIPLAARRNKVVLSTLPCGTPSN